jgi:hypothetical protein
MEIDEGNYYIAVTPSTTNQLIEGLHKIYNPSPVGVIIPNVFALVPIIIKFKSQGPIPKDQIERFHRLLLLKIQNLIKGSIDKLLTQIKVVEKWTDVVTDALIQYENGTAIIKFEYGEVIRGILEIIVSELIMETIAWEAKYNYKIDIKRTDMDIMLVGTCPTEQLLNKFKQRVYDTNLKISARRWELGVSYKRNYLWKKPWKDVIDDIIQESF